jgi:DNA-binding transcriptional ArsR family regulator
MAYDSALQALADPTRRAIFERLRRGAAPVGRLAEGLPVSRPAVSQHLRVLKGAGLVKEKRMGTRRVYSVELRGLAELRRYLDRFWDEALEAFKNRAEAGKEAASSGARRAGAGSLAGGAEGGRREPKKEEPR